MLNNLLSYYPLALCLFVPLAASVIMFLLKEKTKFGKLSYIKQQIIIGIIFGLVAVFATENGVDFNGATANTRDAAPLCAGLIFGGPSGIIAGLIGGIDRWFAVYRGAGAYSRIACSVSTALIGFYAAGLRKFILEKKLPSFPLALASGLVAEVFHMIVLFVTHLTTPEQSIEIVKSVSIPMIITNSIAVGFSVLSVSFITHRENIKTKKKKSLTQLFQTPMLIAIILTFLSSTIFTFFLQTYNEKQNIEDIIELNISDVKNDISGLSDAAFLKVARNIAKKAEPIISEGTGNIDEALKELAEEYSVADIWYVDKKGIVRYSTDNSDGFDMACDIDKPEEERQSSAFLCLLDPHCHEYVQELKTLASNSEEQRKIGGISLDCGGFIQVGLNAEQFKTNVAENIIDITIHRRIGESGVVFITDDNGKVVSVGESADKHNKITSKLFADIEITPDTIIEINEPDNYFLMQSTIEGYKITAVVPTEEAYSSRDTMTYIISFMEVIILSTLFILIFLIIKRVVVKNIRRTNEGLNKIIAGELDTKIDIYTSEEFESLSNDINHTVDTLKKYIADAESRIDMELKFAKQIQHSALPSDFPKTDKFGIFATMDTAKEVGGDFYDYYITDDKHIAFLIADVSGKGIPAAMFMMTAKTVLKNLTENGLPVDEIFTVANNKLCEGNDTAMFVTAWMGILDLDSGLLSFANAGHNPPLIKRNGKNAEYLKSPAGLVLAGMEDMKYKLQTIQLNPGDSIFLYTDGVTEAINKKGDLYGENRLMDFINELPISDEKQILKSIKTDIDRFADGAEQADDITMMAVNFIPQTAQSNITEAEFPAVDESFPEAAELIEILLEKAGASDKSTMQFSVAFEEMYINIVHYAYPKGEGTVKLKAEYDSEYITVVLSDNGIPFDPFSREDPDLKDNADEKKIGGLGIFMTKKLTDEATYVHENGMNIITLKKKLNS